MPMQTSSIAQATTRIALLACAFAATGVQQSAAQTKFAVQSQTSLGWWQVDPHYGHLWATTCPEDPSWQAGESRQGSSPINATTRKKVSVTEYRDKRIPLYPREEVHAVCRPAVSGSVTVADTVGWRGVKGEIKVLGDSLFTGLNMRDSYARKAVLETPHNRYITFAIDSLTSVTTANDTITAIAVGTFQLHGVTQPMQAPVKAWREGANLRVQTHFAFPAEQLVDVYKMSKLALGMGVMMGRWKDMHMGVDVVLAKTP